MTEQTRYTYEFTWECVEYFLPNIKIAREYGVEFNLPSMVKLAAEEIFMLQYEFPRKSNKAESMYVLPIYYAMKDLREKGYFLFGDKSSF